MRGAIRARLAPQMLHREIGILFNYEAYSNVIFVNLSRLTGKGNPNSHGARPVHQIISMIKWIRTTRSMQFSQGPGDYFDE